MSNDTQKNKSLISKKAIICALDLQVYNPRRVDRDATDWLHNSKQAKADAGNYNKSLISKEIMRDLNAIAREVRSYYYEVTVKWGRGRDRILPVNMLAEFRQKMQSFQQRFERSNKMLVAFAEQGRIKEEAKSRLGQLFVESDYHNIVEKLKENCCNYDFAQIADSESAESFLIDLSEQDRREIEQGLREDMSVQYNRQRSAFVKDLFLKLHEVTSRLSETLNDFDFDNADSDSSSDGDGFELLKEFASKPHTGSSLLTELSRRSRSAAKLVIQVLESHPRKINLSKVLKDNEVDANDIFLEFLLAQGVLVKSGQTAMLSCGEKLLDGSIKKDGKGSVIRERQRAYSIVRKNLVDNVKKMTELLPKLNIDNDEALNALIKEVESKLVFDVDTIRENAPARKAKADSAQQMLDKINALMGKA